MVWWMDVVGGMHTGQSLGWSHVERCRKTIGERCDKLHQNTPPSRCAALGMVESELVCLPGKALTRDATRRFRFFVHAVGRLHSMVLHGRC